MNNIKQIIEERLENEKFQNLNEYSSLHTYGFNEGIDKALEILNLIPAPRTETDIINELKALGWNLQKQRLSYEYHFYKYGGYHIEIKGGDKVITYEEGHEDWSCGEYEMHKPIFIPYDVYKLIFELLNLEED
jgi:ribosomal protein L9